jgi:hypothetical protein
MFSHVSGALLDRVNDAPRHPPSLCLNANDFSKCV